MHAHDEKRDDKAGGQAKKAPVVGRVEASASLVALQKMIGNAALGQLLEPGDQDLDVQRSLVHQVLRTPGRPLDEPVRADMEARLGADFSDVRVHTDRTAHESAASVDAEAFTSREHIVFRQGNFDTSSAAGKRMLAHELTHVVQQRSGPVAGTDTGGGLSVSDPSDRFEREAEHVAEQAMHGPVDAHAVGGAPDVIARMMTVGAFKQRTKGFRRGNKIEAVEAALVAYHALPLANYVGRRAQLEVVRQAADGYLQNSDTKKHQAAVDDLVNESHDETNAIRLNAVIQETRQRAAAHQDIYQAVIAADGAADDTNKVRLLMRAQDLIVHQSDLNNTGGEGDLAFLNTKIGEWMTLVASTMDAPTLRLVIADDLATLTRLSTDQSVPAVTRRILVDVLAHQDITEYQTGQPGTRLSNPGADKKYTLRNPVNQPHGSTERLGSLAHEMTHVDAGETYDNTEILLLLRPGLPDDAIKALTDRRRDSITHLRTLLAAHQGFSGNQEQLFSGKLDYTMRGKLEGYAMSFRNAGKIDEATFDHLLHLAELTKPNSGLLVEYDTVLNQLLVYLHQWGVDPRSPLYVEVLRLADQQRQERHP
ncbi:DUF4157 domain-containing protein [Actinokineospora sp. NBRC 105648]|uniref:eCIS core domain-containing protein n=1 Tax=Actinokineospora sp. NBRC 105648 TaxID=3032206 RepID=UPI0024A1EACE|nr:DUF4157 domain-containing protein [Actinokineospora sp. NBRC 105648]GLZ42784.1 hypothetical protein Acsp05_64080 [Actinokineospora sp. NBRC 105648]